MNRTLVPNRMLIPPRLPPSGSNTSSHCTTMAFVWVHQLLPTAPWELRGYRSSWPTAPGARSTSFRFIGMVMVSETSMITFGRSMGNFPTTPSGSLSGRQLILILLVSWSALPNHFSHLTILLSRQRLLEPNYHLPG